jgi:hypothetical protein
MIHDNILRKVTMFYSGNLVVECNKRNAAVRITYLSFRLMQATNKSSDPGTRNPERKQTIYIHTHTHTHTHTHSRGDTNSVYVKFDRWSLQVLRTRPALCTCWLTDRRTSACQFVCVCVCVYIYIYICIHTYTNWHAEVLLSVSQHAQRTGRLCTTWSCI